MCESQGHNPNDPCDRSRFERLSYPAVYTLSFSILLLAPVIHSVFVINIQLLKKKLIAFKNNSVRSVML